MAASISGKNVIEYKFRALEHMLENGIPVTLVSTIQKRVNDDEIGRIVEYGMETNGIRGINFQPVGYFGRMNSTLANDRITLSGIIKEIETQLSHIFKPGDIIPLPRSCTQIPEHYNFRPGIVMNLIVR